MGTCSVYIPLPANERREKESWKRFSLFLPRNNGFSSFFLSNRVNGKVVKHPFRHSVSSFPILVTRLKSLSNNSQNQFFELISIFGGSSILNDINRDCRRKAWSFKGDVQGENIHSDTHPPYRCVHTGEGWYLLDPLGGGEVHAFS